MAMPDYSSSLADTAAQPLAIEDYALIGDCSTCAIVGRNGSIDWLCWPRFDSAACFTSLLGDSGNGRWLIAPEDDDYTVTRSYRGDSLILETVFETKDGAFAVIDFMPPAHDGYRTGNSSLIRIVEGRRGNVAIKMELILRFDYGASLPWVIPLDEWMNGFTAVVGPNLVVLRTPVKLQRHNTEILSRFVISEEQARFLSPSPSGLRILARRAPSIRWRLCTKPKHFGKNGSANAHSAANGAAMSYVRSLPSRH